MNKRLSMLVENTKMGNTRGSTNRIVGLVIGLILVGVLAPIALVGLFNSTAFVGVPAWVPSVLGIVGAIAFITFLLRAGGGK